MPLSDYTVWIIDDDIPMQVLPDNFPLREGFIDGTRPLDHGSLYSILQFDGWEDEAVRDLCRELVSGCPWVCAFKNPSNALAYVENGGRMPDVIIYDVLYEKLGGHNVDSDRVLCQFLERTFSLAQVYTKESEAEARKNLTKAYEMFAPRRVANPLKKSDCNSESLLGVIEKNLQESFPSHLRRTVRNAACLAVERTLVGLDDLYPLPEIAAMLGSIGANDPVTYQDLTDFVVRKVGEHLVSDDAINKSVRAYAKRELTSEVFSQEHQGFLGAMWSKVFGQTGVKAPERRVLSEEELDTVTSLLIERIVNSLREGIHSERAFLEGIAAASKAASKQSTLKVANATPLRLSRFVHLWMYSEPLEETIATGDILSIVTNGAESLYFVTTPLCDLGDFWKKTRSSLTVLPLEALKMGGKETFKLHQKLTASFSTTNISQVANGGSQGPVILPSVRIADGESCDYLLFSHCIESLDVRKVMVSDRNVGGKFQDPPKKLTLAVLEAALRQGGKEVKVSRLCRLAEPFLSPVLSHISNTLFQSAFPDLPSDEMARVNKLLA